MASKLQEYRRMSEEAQKQLTGSLERWQSFLTTASRLYKYPYNEQVMIHAQRPDATACAEYDVWNNTMRRYVRRGSKGIALIDTSGDRERLRYVFDVSDTGARPNSRNVNLWVLQDEHLPAVSAMLETGHGAPVGVDLATQLEAVASSLAREYWEENRRDVLDIVADSFLEEYDEFNIGVAFRNAAEVSITYSLMSRCGLNPNDYFEHEDFMSVFDFNTPDTAGALGTAVSGINQQVLREIGATIRNYERQKLTERSAEHGNDLHAERGLSDPGHQTERAGGETYREVRADAENVPEGTPPDSLEPAGAVGEAVPAPSGDRRGGVPEAGRDASPDGEAGGRDRGAEAERPAEMGRVNEQPESAGGGSDPGRAGVQLTGEESTEPALEGTATEEAVAEEPAIEEPAVEEPSEEAAIEEAAGEKSAEEAAIEESAAEPEPPMETDFPERPIYEQLTLNLFPSETEQIQMIDEADRTHAVPSAFSFAQSEIDDILRFGSNTSHAREHIVDAFQKQKAISEIAGLLQKEFHGGYGIKGEHGDYAAWYAEDGIYLHKGREARYASGAQIIPWEAAAERIRQMMEEGSFATNVELAEAGGIVRSELALNLLYLKNDLTEKAREQGYLSCMDGLPWGYPNATAALSEKLADPAFVPELWGEYALFYAADSAAPGLRRFYYHKMDEMWRGIRDLSLERGQFPEGPAELPAVQGFITEDEINESLAGGASFEGSKGRIYGYFSTSHTRKEQADFLKKEYGEGGRSHAVSRSDHSSEDHNSRGIKLKKGDCYPVELNWNKVAERVASLVQKDRYLTPKEQEQYQQNLRRNSLYNTYNEVKHDHPDDMVLFQVGDFFELYGEDARQASDLLDLRRTARDIPGVGRVDVVIVPPYALSQYVEELRAQFDVTISAVPKDSTERDSYTLRAFVQEPEQTVEASEPESKAVPGDEADLSRYDIGYGAMGNGVTVWNRKEEEHGDYKTIAHIDPDRTVKFYDENLPDAVKEQIQHFADTAEMTLSATQDASVFSVPPVGKEPVLEEEPEQTAEEPIKESEPAVTLDKPVPTAESPTPANEKPVSEARPVSPEEINDALIHWNGSSQSKSRVNDYMLAHGRERSAAGWLKDEFGGGDTFSVVTVHGSLELPWAKVQRQLGILVNNGKFLAEVDRMLMQAEDVAARNAIEPYERFLIIETDEGYGVWDDLHDGLYVDEDGVTADFDSEWAAESYLLELKEKVAQQEAAEWEYVERSKYQALNQENETENRQSQKDTASAEQPPEMEPIPQIQNDNDLIGVELTIDGRRFVVDEICDGRASLRDITFQNGTGFPIFRNESVETVRNILYPEQTTQKVNLTAIVTDAQLELLRPQLEAAGIGYLVSNGGYNQKHISFSSEHYREVQDMLDALPEEPEQPRFTVEQTSDAFEEPFIIRDNSVPEGRDGQYYDVGGIYQTFGSEQEAQEYADRLNGKEPAKEINGEEKQSEEQPGRASSGTATIYPGEKNGLPYDIVVERLHIPEPEHTPPAPTQETDTNADVDSDAVLDASPTSVQIDGEWHTFPNAEAAEQAMRDAELAAARAQAQNYHILDDHLGEGGPKEKFWRNTQAIATLKQIESEGRLATPEEQHILSQYVGWGGLPDAFDPDKPAWSAEYEELKGLLTPAEYEAARASTLNAHYTSPTVIRAMYEALGNMGFEAGNILEPSMGVGNFFGCLPESMQNSRLYGVELDSITGRIAKQLYPKADITVAGFETTNRRDFYDVAIGNVPFGQYQVNDRAYNKLGFSIHDYFFAKALDQVRPGGVIAFVTSRYTMDKQSPEVRKYIAQRAELLGAIRLPNNAFKANAGTEVVSDIIFLQRRDRPIEIEPDWVHLGQSENGFAVNSYFAEHPEMVLGRQSSESTQYGKQDFTVEPFEGADLADLLHEAIQNIHGNYQAAELPDLGEDEALIDTLPADPNVKNYSYTVVDGEVYYRQNSVMSKPALNATAAERVKGMVGLRDCLHRLIDLQMDAQTTDSEIQKAQAELNTLYDSFSARYGLLNSRANALAFQDDSSYYLLCTLEDLDEEKQLRGKADIFTKRTIKPHQVVTSVDTPSEALALSISEKAKVDLGYMEQLTGMAQEDLISGLQGVIFLDPAKQEWQTADEYLSGNVRQKLREAERAAERDPAYLPNVEALRSSQPKDLDASEIEVRLGATWIGQRYIQQFMEETFEPPFYQRRNIQVHYSPFTAEWNISGKSTPSYSDVNAYMTYGTDRANAYKILEDTLNLRDVRIYDTVTDPDGKEKRVLNSKETTLAQQKQQAIRDAFQDWIWKDPDRRQDLVQTYNELFNSNRPREYDGHHISFSGMNPEIQLREHQLNAVAHILYGGNTLLAHEVGAGKTFEMVAAAMESKRLGLCHKPMFVVPNHLTEQWASEFLRLYPSANILAATKKDFEPKNRKKFCARIATGDYDAIIIGHSQFERIPVSMERQERLLREQIEEVTEGIEELKASRAENFTIKSMERTKKGLEAKLKKLMESGRKDDVVTFEELGVDRLYVDEAHAFKNLFLYTKMRNVAGLSTTDAQKSSDMLLKCRYIDELTDGKGVIFATGTPVSNSMTELYTMMRYLQHDTLQWKGLAHFDCWASTFGETVTALELAPEGTGYRARTRFAKFFNLPELMTLFKEVADIKTADQLDLPRPEAVYHNVVAQPTEIQKAMVQKLSDRAAKVHSGAVDASVDNMLKITTDGRKLGLDQRIINPDLPDEPQSKVNQCVDNIYRIWDEGQADKLTQLVFCDLSTPKTGAPAAKAAKSIAGNIDSPELHAVVGAIGEEPPEPEFTVYDDIREKLVGMGIPREQIAFIHDANTEARKKELFAKVRSGQVRVLMGSTFKMGAGMNVQDRLVALHDLDAPWRPGDLEQRSGRIIRQGNRNEQVHIYRYVTEATFDAYLWQTLENKQKFISQIMTSKSPVRSCEDIDETALSYAEIKALCAGDERIKEKMDLDVDVARLKLMKANHQSQQYRLEDNILRHFPEQIEQNKGFIEGFRADLQTLAEHPHPQDGFAGMTVRGDVLTDKENAGAALVDAMKEVKSLEPVPIGSYRGFQMSLTLEDFGKQYILTLKGKMTHRVKLGKDPRGNLIRIDNALNGMETRMQRVQEKLDSLYAQMEVAKAELGKPFPQEQELREKSARLAQLNIELNIDDKTPLEAMMDVSDDTTGQRPAMTAKAERPSVLAKLHAPLPQRSNPQKQNEAKKEVR